MFKLPSQLCPQNQRLPNGRMLLLQTVQCWSQLLYEDYKRRNKTKYEAKDNKTVNFTTTINFEEAKSSIFKGTRSPYYTRSRSSPEKTVSRENDFVEKSKK
jgi:hypothetical protein